MPKWTATTILRELKKFLDENAIDPSGPISEVIDLLRDQIVDEALGGQTSILPPEDAPKPPRARVRKPVEEALSA